jgi:signal transduction histidine kinase
MKSYLPTWLHRIKSKILSKITLLVMIEILLIVGSFGVLAYFQSEQSSLGNSINIAGKNRYLTANLLLQTEKYLYGLSSSSDISQLKDAINNLEANIMTLKQGGMISGVDLKPLPSNLLDLWNNVDSRWNIYKTYVTNTVLALPSEARTTTATTKTNTITDRLLERKVAESTASNLIEPSDRLVTLLGQHMDKNTQNLMLLQILFAILIIGIMVLILYLVARMLRPIFALSQAISKVKKGNLDVSVKQKGCDELSTLSQSFNSMVDSIRDYSKKQNELTKHLEEVNEELKYKDQLKDEFINIAAHELRAPIQPIIGLSEVIRSRRSRSNNSTTGAKAGDQEFLDTIVRNAKRLQALSENILDITKIESRTLKLKKENFNINKKIENVIDDIRSKEEQQDEIKISFDKPKADPIVVEADQLRIYQVISNLLTNAVKSTKKSFGSSGSGKNNNSSLVDIAGGTITVFTAIKKSNTYAKNDNTISSISNNHDHDEVIVSIKDRGTGIDPDMHDKLFSKFATKSDTGSGLGLYISKGIVEAHDGRIWAENNSDGNGATFAFSLPINKENNIIPHSKVNKLLTI